MKTLKKLSINPEKVIKNEELVNLKGGYDLFGSGPYFFSCKDETSGNTCGHFWTDSCTDPNNWTRCAMIPSCNGSHGGSCV
jgi:hypothetical protein